jgi:hypothetical protein
MPTLDELIKSEAMQGCSQKDWDRQRRTAHHFTERFAADYKTQLLADEVGMGKTYVALSVMAHHVFQNSRNNRKVLLITPPSRVLQAKWEQEIRSFDSNYILRKNEKSKRLRPILLESYWDFIENLHDYENQTIERFSESLYRCFLQALFLWGVKNKKTTRRRTPWILLEEFNEYHPDYLEFCSRFSQHALYSYYDRHFPQMVNIIKELNNGERCDNEYKSLIRRFAPDQDSNEANVYLLGMNSLRKPRLDAWQFRRLNTYYTGFLLKNRWQSSRKTVIDFLEQQGLLIERQLYERKTAYYEWISDLSSRDMFGLRGSVEHCTADEQVQSEWNEIHNEIMRKVATTNKLRDFYKRLSSKILKEKLRTAKIGLCVIDEVHNWKNGSNGAEEFRDHYAENIPNKLIMSATPFQIHEDELRNLFSYLDGKRNLSSAALDRIYQGVNLLQTCIDKSSAFQAAWTDLEDADIKVLNNVIEDSRQRKGDTSIMNKLREYPSFSETLSSFIQKASDYKEAVEKLKSELSLFIVRHTKGRMKRDYHIGRSYRTSQLDPAVPCRTSLYSTSGYANTVDAFINFMAIRLDQKIRQDTQAKYETNAHLMGGITSSTAAFRESNQKLCKLKAVSSDTRDYQQLFMRMLDHHDHPKVSATVERVFKNYCEGRKTLVFCERRATLDEIRSELENRIDEFIKNLSNSDNISRETLLRNHVFVDNYWWRSILLTLEPSRKKKLEDMTEKALSNIKKSIEQDLIDQNKAYTPRQILRKADVLLFQQMSKEIAANASYKKALRLFSELGSEYIDNAGTRDIEDSETDAERLHAANVVDNYLSTINIWFGSEDKSAELHKSVWNLLESEAGILIDTYGEESDREQRIASFGGMLVDIMKGLRKIALREDLIALYCSGKQVVDPYLAIQQGFYSKQIGNQTVFSRILMFLKILFESNGSIIMAESTKRRSLWQGMFRREMSVVDVLHGDKDQDARIKLCAAFNSPLQPDILVCTAIGSEGIDLHRQCAEIIHHDLPWNPAKLEQRIGRIDRVGSLAEVSPDRFIQIGIPFLEHNYEKFQYDLLWSRAQRFEILMGEPDFDVNAQDEEKIDEIKDGSSKPTKEQDCDVPDGNAVDIKVAHLPEEVLDYLRIDLSLMGS